MGHSTCLDGGRRGPEEMRWTSQLGRLGRRDAPRRRSLPGPTGQGGFSLIEIVIAVALVALGVLALASGFLTLVRTNAVTAAQQKVNHAAANYAESLKAAQYLPCEPSGPDPDYDAGADLWAGDGDVRIEVLDVEYWNTASQDYQEACLGPDAGTQRVTVRAEWQGQERQAQIVKRNR